MSNLSVRIGRSRPCFFTKTQKNKLEAGIELFKRALDHKSFADNLLKFNWINSDKKRFHRFYHASGLSNNQVLNRLQNYQAYFEELGISEQLVLLPYNSRKEIKSYNLVNSPIIWISLSCLNNNWFTPVHVASAIGHELAILLGLDNSVGKFSRLEYVDYKVPNFVGHLILKTAALWKHSISDIRESFDQIDISQYNYFPTSSILDLAENKAIPHYQTSFDELISSLLIEQEALFALQDKLTSSETTRLICLEEVLLNLNKLKSKLTNCSLDGSEFDFQFQNSNVGPREGKAGY